jgi:zinc protease
MPGQAPEALEKELVAELERLKDEAVTAEELQRAKNQIEAAFVFQEDSVHSRASLLARFQLTGGFQEKDVYLQRIRAVTAADIRRVAQAHFLDSKKNVGILIPTP